MFLQTCKIGAVCSEGKRWLWVKMNHSEYQLQKYASLCAPGLIIYKGMLWKVPCLIITVNAFRLAYLFVMVFTNLCDSSMSWQDRTTLKAKPIWEPKDWLTEEETFLWEMVELVSWQNTYLQYYYK